MAEDDLAATAAPIARRRLRRLRSQGGRLRAAPPLSLRSPSASTAARNSGNRAWAGGASDAAPAEAQSDADARDTPPRPLVGVEMKPSDRAFRRNSINDTHASNNTSVGLQSQGCVPICRNHHNRIDTHAMRDHPNNGLAVKLQGRLSLASTEDVGRWWRRWWDSNPREALSPCPFLRWVPSATRRHLREPIGGTDSSS